MGSVIEPTGGESSSIPPTEEEPHVVLQAGPVLVACKPGGLLTQAPPGIDSLEWRLRRWLKGRAGDGAGDYLATLHRLDRPASGLLIFATEPRAARRLSRQFERREVRKTYWAIIEGVPDGPAGRWVDFMRKIPGEARSELVAAEHPDAQFAALDYRVLASDGATSLLEIQLETGRTHQIRLQAGARGFPLLGDELYGGMRAFGPPAEDLRLRWIALLARRLQFTHPLSGQPIDVVAPWLRPWESGGGLIRQAELHSAH